tara:strand:- start:123 stop:494 length:372 start_codon:yes stop_codon:yes gene_type:complete
MEVYTSINVFGKELEMCCENPMTGFFRNGMCDTCKEDRGVHTVCILVTEEFLVYSKSVGNDLTTPHPDYEFAGLKPGDRWCLCALRWQEAYDNGKAPPVYLESTHQRTLKHVDFNLLQQFAVN